MLRTSMPEEHLIANESNLTRVNSINIMHDQNQRC